MDYLLIAAGGGLGALLRYVSSRFVNTSTGGTYPLGTLFVNCLGALLIGFLINIFDAFSPDFSANARWKLFLVTGFLGGFTTFSAYSLETAEYIFGGNIKYAVINILLNNALCVFFALLGIWIYKRLL